MAPVRSSDESKSNKRDVLADTLAILRSDAAQPDAADYEPSKVPIRGNFGGQPEVVARRRSRTKGRPPTPKGVDRRKSWKVHCYAEHEAFLDEMGIYLRNEFRANPPIPCRSDVLRFAVRRVSDSIADFTDSDLAEYVTARRQAGEGKCETVIAFALSKRERAIFAALERFIRSRGFRKGVSEATVVRIALSMAASDPNFPAALVAETLNQRKKT